MLKSNFSDGMYTLGTMSVRNLKLFFLDKMGVFLSVLAPLIVLVLYLLFLRDVQLDSITSALADLNVDEKAMGAFVDSWMLSDTLGLACITVSLAANSVMVTDYSSGIMTDSAASPAKRWSTKLSYFVSNYIITISICAVVLAIAFIYLGATGGWYLSVGDVFSIIGTLILSTLSATLITTLLISFVKTPQAMGSIIGIMSAILGFLLGAYMPLSTFPKAIRIICGLIPGAHATGIFRNFFLDGALNNIVNGLPQEAAGGVAESLKSTFGFNVDFFNTELGLSGMFIVVAVSVVIFFALDVAVISLGGKKNRFTALKSKKSKPQKDNLSNN